jgi:hypothetical protein
MPEHHTASIPAETEPPQQKEGLTVKPHVDLAPPLPLPPPPSSHDSIGGYGKDTLFMLLGAIVSLYVTVVFERYRRFGDLLRDVAQARQHFEGLPSSTSASQLTRSHELSIDFFRLLESRVWSLNADGHFEAAARLDMLKDFIYRTVACIEHMLAGQTKGLPINEYLSLFSIEYGRIHDKHFIAFERGLRPNLAALLRPYPHPVAPERADVILVDFFNQLL